MMPTSKLVTDLINAEACYINTGHPDFLSGHKAMAIVSDRMNPKTPPPPAPNDPRQSQGLQKPMAPQQQSLAAALPPRDPNADLLNQQNDGFFGSFFKQKKKPGILENASFFSPLIVFYSMKIYKLYIASTCIKSNR
jgi:hypothetical protein